jgi:NADH-quinone oxidoreductase subunit L
MQLWLIPLLPLAGFTINGLFGRRFSKGMVNAVGIGSVTLSFAWVLKTLIALGTLHTAYNEHYFTWIQSDAFAVGCDFSIDRLTAIMLLVVTGIGSLITFTASATWRTRGGTTVSSLTSTCSCFSC